MDGLSGAASVMAAVSITLQLVGTVNTLRDFWLSMKSAQEDVEEIVDDLALLKHILDGVKRAYTLHKDPNDADPAHAESVYLALLRCQRHVNRMAAFINNFHVGHAGKQYFTSFKITMRRRKIAEFAFHLEQAKLTLLMAVNVTTLLLQNECGRKVQEQFSSLRSDLIMLTTDAITVKDEPLYAATGMQSVSESTFCSQNERRNRSSEVICSKSRRITGSDILLWLLQLPPHSIYRKTLAHYGLLVGRIGWQSSTRVINNHGSQERFHNSDKIESSIVITIELPFVRRAFLMRSQKSFGQWTHSFRVSRIVPDDSPIFKICATKDELTLRKFFDSGMASPFDQTASGVTLLHVAAAGYKSGTYKLLCEAGVEYGHCEDILYGKLTPIELTQNFSIFAEGRRQTVQEWLGIFEDQDSVFHPESHYDSVRKIWNDSVETQEEISDAEILTLLQGPLRLPRGCSPLVEMAGDTSYIDGSPLRYSPSLLLLCYYYMFDQDPYGCRVTKATMLNNTSQQSVGLCGYVGQYWNRKEWLRLLALCRDLDFQKLAGRQQDKYCPPAYRRIWDADRAKWVKRRVAEFSSSDDIYFNVWIGPLKDWTAIFEFEDEQDADIFELEIKEVPPIQLETTIIQPNQSWLAFIKQTLGILKHKEQPRMLCWILLFMVFQYFSK